MPNLPITVPHAPAPSPTGILKVKGTDIVAENGIPIILKGAGLGGHLNMENCRSRLSVVVVLLDVNPLWPSCALELAGGL